MVYFLQYLIMQIFIWFVHLLPWKLAYFLGTTLGDVLYFVVKPRKNLILENLNNARGFELNCQEKEKLTRQVYRNFGKTLIEFVKIIRWDKKTIDKVVKIEGLDNLQEAKQRGKGVVLLTGHIGNWHVMGMAVTLNGYPVNNVIKRQRNSWVADWIAAQIERAKMRSIFQSSNNPREIIKALRNGDIVEFLGDLHAGDGGVFIDFLGRPASTYPGPVVLAIRTGAPIVVAVDVRLKDNTHRVFIEEPVYLDAGKADEEQVIKHLFLLTKRLEKYIIKYPDQWFWLHNRWKTQPENKESEGL